MFAVDWHKIDSFLFWDSVFPVSDTTWMWYTQGNQSLCIHVLAEIFKKWHCVFCSLLKLGSLFNKEKVKNAYDHLKNILHFIQRWFNCVLHKQPRLVRGAPIMYTTKLDPLKEVLEPKRTDILQQNKPYDLIKIRQSLKGSHASWHNCNYLL